MAAETTTDVDDIELDDYEIAEMQDRMSNLTETLFYLAELDADRGRLTRLVDRVSPWRNSVPWKQLFENWRWLWRNPDEFENAANIERWRDEEEDVLWAFELGVLFGIDYEQAYPEGRNDEWPIPVDERGTKPEPDRGTKAIPLYVFTSLTEEAEEHHEYAVVRSDNDYRFAETLEEANEIRDEMQSQADFLAPIGHTVQVVELQEEPPNA